MTGGCKPFLRIPVICLLSVLWMAREAWRTTRAGRRRLGGQPPGATIAAVGEHTLRVKGDGTVWAWGRNVCGQLGDGTTTQRLTPVRVSGLTGVVAIAAR